jgi:hypothetical protein
MIGLAERFARAASTQAEEEAEAERHERQRRRAEPPPSDPALSLAPSLQPGILGDHPATGANVPAR